MLNEILNPVQDIVQRDTFLLKQPVTPFDPLK